jgi:hypothetical protein
VVTSAIFSCFEADADEFPAPAGGGFDFARGWPPVVQVLKFTGNNWTICFWVAARIYLVGAACWLFIDPVTPLDGSLEREEFSTS